LARIADSQAILVGDLALAWSMELMTAADRTGGKKRPVALEAFYRTLDEVVVGQMIEVDVTTRQAITLEELEHKHLYKTVRYSFVGPLRIGARLATRSTKKDGFAERFGEALGMGFSIQDDLLDVASDSTKGILTDLVQRQHTYLTYYVLERAQPKYKKILLQYFGRPVVADDAKKIVEMFHASGAVAFAQVEAKKHFVEARRLLDSGPVPKMYRVYWQSIIDIIEQRKS
jgi:geranylgeranyl diphosphate synthase type I